MNLVTSNNLVQNAFKKYKNNNFLLVISNEEDVQDPRSYMDFMSYMYFDNEHDCDEPICLPDGSAVLANNNEIISIDTIYKYEHSSIAFSLKKFSDKFDSWPCGFMVVTKRNFKNMTGKEFTGSDDDLKRIEEQKTYELSLYQDYINGEVYEYHVFQNSKFVHIKKCDYIDLEDRSLWILLDEGSGFYGMNFDSNGMLETLFCNDQQCSKLIYEEKEYKNFLNFVKRSFTK